MAMKKVRTGEERDTSNIQKTNKQTNRIERKFNAEMDAGSAKLAQQPVIVSGLMRIRNPGMVCQMQMQNHLAPQT